MDLKDVAFWITAVVSVASSAYAAGSKRFEPLNQYLVSKIDTETLARAGFDMHEDGIGMARTFAMEFTGEVDAPVGPQSGFFAWVDGAPAAGYRAPRNPAGDTGMRCFVMSTPYFAQ